MSVSYSKDSDGAVVGKECWITAVSLLGGTGDSECVLFDNASEGTGTVLLDVKAKAGESHSVSFPDPLRASSGVYADLTGAGAKVFVYVR